MKLCCWLNQKGMELWRVETRWLNSDGDLEWRKNANWNKLNESEWDRVPCRCVWISDSEDPSAVQTSLPPWPWMNNRWWEWIVFLKGEIFFYQNLQDKVPISPIYTSAVFVLRLLLPSPKALKIEIIKNRIDPNQCMFQKEKEKTSFYDKKEKKNSIKKKKIYILFLREKNIYILKRFSF